MNEDAKFTRVIRINLIGGAVVLGGLAVSFMLMAVGYLPSDPSSLARMLVFGVVPVALLFLTAWLARREKAAARESEAKLSRRMVETSEN